MSDELNELSNCCGANVSNGRCLDCKEMCDITNEEITL